MNNSPYLDRPLRTLEQARADAESRRKPDPYAGSCIAREASDAERCVQIIEEFMEFADDEIRDILDDDLPCLSVSPTRDKAYTLACRLRRLADALDAIKPMIIDTSPITMEEGTNGA